MKFFMFLFFSIFVNFAVAMPLPKNCEMDIDENLTKSIHITLDSCNTNHMSEDDCFVLLLSNVKVTKNITFNCSLDMDEWVDMIKTIVEYNSITNIEDDMTAISFGVETLFEREDDFSGLLSQENEILKILGYNNDNYTLKVVDCAYGINKCFSVSFDTGDEKKCNKFVSRQIKYNRRASCDGTKVKMIFNK